MDFLNGLIGQSESNEDIVLTHLLLVLGLKEGVRRVVLLALSRREKYLERLHRVSHQQDQVQGGEDVEEEGELTEGSKEVKELLEIVEVCLWHGLKRSKTGEKEFWDLILALEKINEQAFGPSRMLAELNSKATTRKNLCRAWIRQLLNQNALEFTLRALCKNAATIASRFYEDWAFLRWSNEANRTMFFHLLACLNDIGFRIDVSAFESRELRSPGKVVTSSALSCAITIDSGVAATSASLPPVKESLLVMSVEDLQCSGRFVYLEKRLYGNKLTGFQVRYGPWQSLVGWGLFDPQCPETPLYFAPSSKDNEPPLIGWRVADRKGVFKPPSMLKLSHPLGLATLLEKKPPFLHKQALVRDEIQSLRVEIKQVEHLKDTLDISRKRSPEELLSQPPSNREQTDVRPAHCEQHVEEGTEGVKPLPAKEGSMIGHEDRVGCGQDDMNSERSQSEVGIETEQAVEQQEVDMDQDKTTKAFVGREDGEGTEGDEKDEEDLVAEGDESDEVIVADSPAGIVTAAEEKEAKHEGTIHATAEEEEPESPKLADDSEGTIHATAEEEEPESPKLADDSECEEETSKKKTSPKKRGKRRVVKVADFEETLDSVWQNPSAVKQPHHASQKVKVRTSVLKARVFEEPRPVKIDAKTPLYALDANAALIGTVGASQLLLNDGNEDQTKSPSTPPQSKREQRDDNEVETDEERMLRFQKEEEESLAAYVAEIEKERQERTTRRPSEPDGYYTYDPHADPEAEHGDESQIKVREDPRVDVDDEDDGGTFHTPLSSPTAAKRRSRTLAKDNSESELYDLVRKYVSLQEDSEEARTVAQQILQSFNYVIGPIEKKPSPRAKQGTKSGGSFFERHIKAWSRDESDRNAHTATDADNSILSGDGQEYEAPLQTSSQSPRLILPKGPIDLNDDNLGQVLHAQVAGQHIKRGKGAHVRFVIRVTFTNVVEDAREEDAQDSGVGDAAILDRTDADETAGYTMDGSSDPSCQVSFTVQRRFSEFKAFLGRLQSALGTDVQLPALPKTAWMRSFSEDYILKKRLALNAFLQDLLGLHPFGTLLSRHPLVIEFLTKDPVVFLHSSVFSKASSKAPVQGGIRLTFVTEERPNTYMLEGKDSEGLSEQNFKCANCSGDIGIALGNAQGFFRTQREKSRLSARFCHYSERWFCPSCFLHGRPAEKSVEDVLQDELDGDENAYEPDEYLRMLPSRIVHHWDFDMYPVSYVAAVFLDSVFDQPLLCLSAYNPKLFSQIKMLQHARLLRLQLVYAKEIVETCVKWPSRSNVLGSSFEGRDYLAKETELYSMRDLLEMYQGTLIPSLMRVVERLAEHITEECDYCHAKGHICEICEKHELIYSFQIMTVVQCRKCNGFFHRTCFAANDGENNCLRCLRKKR